MAFNENQLTTPSLYDPVETPKEDTTKKTSGSSGSSNSSKSSQLVSVTKIFRAVDVGKTLQITSSWQNDANGNNKPKSSATTGTLTIKTNITLPFKQEGDVQVLAATSISTKFYCTFTNRQSFSKIQFKNPTPKPNNNQKKIYTATGDSVKVTNDYIYTVATNDQQYASVVCNATATVFQGQGYKNSQTAKLYMSDAYFEVTFKIPYYLVSQYTEQVYTQDIASYQQSRTQGAFPNKPQVAFIYDKNMNTFLQFDGVTKVQMNNQVGIQDDKSNQKKAQKYLNNCKDEADEITLQVMESNVYTNTSQFEGNGEMTEQGYGLTRAAATYQYLYDLKQARRVVDVYTTLKFLSSFVVKSITVTLDENNTDGWSGSIVLHEYIDPDDQTSGNSLGGVDKNRNSNLYNHLGMIWRGTK